MRPLMLQTIVVAADLDRSSDPAIECACRLAAAAGAALHVVHAMDAVGDRGEPAVRRAVDDALQAAIERAGSAPRHVAVDVVPGAPAATIRGLAERLGADVIVLGPHRDPDADAGDRGLGGTAREIVERAYVPCLVAPRALKLPLDEVLVPVDLSETARGALLVALTWASALRSRGAAAEPTSLTALHVAPSAADDADTREAVAETTESVRRVAGEWAGVAMRVRTVTGSDTAGTIAACAREYDADLVVLGTRGRGAGDVARIGSVSAAVTALLEIPILLVPPAVWRLYGASGEGADPPTPTPPRAGRP